MKTENTAIRLNRIMKERRLKQVDILEMARPYCNKFGVKLNKNDLSQYVSGKVEPGQNKLLILGRTLDVSEAWLMGYDVPMERNDNIKNIKYPAPEITEDYTTFPVIGEIAAGYDNPAYEDYDGEVVEIPNSYLKGRQRDEFFVLKVKGDSMYPMYQDGDRVLILKQATLNNSGDIGAVLYDDEYGTLKKVEYVMGEDWMRLVPINPTYKPELIEGERLEHCRVMGIPKLLIRDI